MILTSSCPQASVQHVRGETALPEDLLEMVLPASRCASQAMKSFSVVSRSLFLFSGPGRGGVSVKAPRCCGR